MPNELDYRQQLESFYKLKSRIDEKNLKILHPKKSNKKSKSKINTDKFIESYQNIHQHIADPYTVENLTLKRIQFTNEMVLMNQFKLQIKNLSNKIKELELDMLYDLRDINVEYELYKIELDKLAKLKKEFNIVLDRRRNRIKNENSEKENHLNEIERLTDAYKMAPAMQEKIEAYKEILVKRTKYFEQHNITDVIIEKQRKLVDEDNEKNKDETNVMVNRCILNYEPIISIDTKLKY